MLIMPLIMDQYTNAMVVKQNGFGEIIDFCNFDEEEFERKLKMMLKDET